MIIRKKSFEFKIEDSFKDGYAKGKVDGVKLGTKEGFNVGVAEGKRMRQTEVDELVTKIKVMEENAGELKTKIKILENELDKAKSVKEAEFKVDGKNVHFKSTITDEDKKSKAVDVKEVKKQIEKKTTAKKTATKKETVKKETAKKTAKK